MVTGLVIGVVVTYLFMQCVQPYIEIWLEVYRTNKALCIEKGKLRLEVIRCKVIRRYPELTTVQGNTVIEGFQYVGDDTCDYDEQEQDEHDELVEDRIIGYKLG